MFLESSDEYATMVGTVTSSSLSGGRDFYDDGYEEDDKGLENRIRFDPEKFYGRNEELQTLHRLFSSLNSQTNAPTVSGESKLCGIPVALVSGYSGTGKSKLVYRFIDELEQKYKEGKAKSFYFLSGKFEELQRADPFAPIVHAFTNFSSLLLKGDEKELERIRHAIKSAIGDEVDTIATVVPGLMSVLGSTGQKNLNESKENAWNQLKYLFQCLLKAICIEDRPIILFLDDLQWADSASLDLIVALVKDTSLRHFMFVATIRSNEVDKDHLLTKKLDLLEKAGRKIDRINLMSLSLEEVVVFIADTLSLEEDDTRSLAEAVYGKTRGNIFFTMQALEELERKNVLYYSLISFQWEWNLKGVEIEAGLSDNVLEVVATKIQIAPAKLQRALIIAAYTRSTIDRETLRDLMSLDGCLVQMEELVKLLDIAVLEGLLSNSVGSCDYKFAHDRIQQAAYSLVAPGPLRDRLKMMIGRRLYELALQRTGEDWMFFVAADHLNSLSTAIDDPILLVELNLTCGRKASEVAAFLSASQYLKKKHGSN